MEDTNDEQQPQLLAKKLERLEIAHHDGVDSKEIADDSGLKGLPITHEHPYHPALPKPHPRLKALSRLQIPPYTGSTPPEITNPKELQRMKILAIQTVAALPPSSRFNGALAKYRWNMEIIMALEVQSLKAGKKGEKLGNRSSRSEPWRGLEEGVRLLYTWLEDGGWESGSWEEMRRREEREMRETEREEAYQALIERKFKGVLEGEKHLGKTMAVSTILQRTATKAFPWPEKEETEEETRQRKEEGRRRVKTEAPPPLVKKFLTYLHTTNPDMPRKRRRTEIWRIIESKRPRRRNTG